MYCMYVWYGMVNVFSVQLPQLFGIQDLDKVGTVINLWIQQNLLQAETKDKYMISNLKRKKIYY